MNKSDLKIGDIVNHKERGRVLITMLNPFRGDELEGGRKTNQFISINNILSIEPPIIETILDPNELKLFIQFP